MSVHMCMSTRQHGADIGKHPVAEVNKAVLSTLAGHMCSFCPEVVAQIKQHIWLQVALHVHITARSRTVQFNGMLSSLGGQMCWQQVSATSALAVCSEVRHVCTSSSYTKSWGVFESRDSAEDLPKEFAALAGCNTCQPWLAWRIHHQQQICQLQKHVKSWSRIPKLAAKHSKRGGICMNLNHNKSQCSHGLAHNSWWFAWVNWLPATIARADQDLFSVTPTNPDPALQDLREREITML